MGNYIDILKEAKEKGILLDSCGNIEREKDTGLYTDLCGSSVEEMTPKGGGGSGSGSTVTISNLLPSGNRVATINVDGVNYTVRSPYQEQADWNEANSGSSSYIKNKPDISIFESKSNKVTTLDSGATDEQYPSAKSTYDALLQKINGSGVTDVIVMTQAEYDSLAEKDPQKFYVVEESFLSNGVYILYTDGTLTNYDTRDYSKTPVGPVLKTDKVCFVIYPSGSSGYWSGVYGVISGVTTVDNESDALADYNGLGNTDAACSGPTSHAAFSWARNAQYSDGRIGYLPACGELKEIKDHSDEINAALTLVQGSVIKWADNVWSSTQKSSSQAWQWYNSSNSYEVNNKKTYGWTRSVSTYTPPINGYKLYKGSILIADSTFETKNNKVTTIDSGSTDEQYPSAKATYDALEQKVNGSGVTDVIVMTQAEYNALTEKDEQKFYVVEEELDATFGGLTFSPAPLYYGANGFEIKDDDWNHNSYNDKYGLVEGSYYFSIPDLATFFDSRGTQFDNQHSIDNLGNKVSYNGKNDWRLPTSVDFTKLISNREGGTVNGNNGKHYSRCTITDVMFNNESVYGFIFFPDKEINGKALNGYDSNTNTNLSKDELNVYLEQGCIFIPHFGYYFPNESVWKTSGEATSWSATRKNGYFEIISFNKNAYLSIGSAIYTLAIPAILVSDTIKKSIKLYKGSTLITDSENQPVQSDWTEEDSGKTSYIKNKPNLPETVVEGDGILKIKSLLQSEYDALETKDPFTLYVVKPDPIPYDEQYLTFEITDIPNTRSIAASAPYLVFGRSLNDSGPLTGFTPTLQYRKNGGNWEDFLVLGDEEALYRVNGEVAVAGSDYADETVIRLNNGYYVPVEVGDIIEVRGTNLSGTCIDKYYRLYKFGPNKDYSDGYLDLESYMPSFKLYGNLLSIIYGDDFANHTSVDVKMYYLFDYLQNSIVSIDGLVLPDVVSNDSSSAYYGPLHMLLGGYRDAYKYIEMPATKSMYDLKYMLGEGDYDVDGTAINLGDAFYDSAVTIQLPSTYDNPQEGYDREDIIIEENDYEYPIYIEAIEEDEATEPEPTRGLSKSKTRGDGSGSGSGQLYTFTIIPDPEWAKVYLNGDEGSYGGYKAGSVINWRVEADGYVTATGTYTMTEDDHTEYVNLEQECDCDGSGSGSGSGGGCDDECCDCDAPATLSVLKIHLRKDTLKLIEKLISVQYAFYSYATDLGVLNPIEINLSQLAEGTRFHDGILVNDVDRRIETTFTKMAVYTSQEGGMEGNFEEDNRYIKVVFGDNEYSIDFDSGLVEENTRNAVATR